MAKEQDWTPWYRRKEYKGNLTEEEKRHLDSFRLEEKHPAVAVDDFANGSDEGMSATGVMIMDCDRAVIPSATGCIYATVLYQF